MATTEQRHYHFGNTLRVLAQVLVGEGDELADIKANTQEMIIGIDAVEYQSNVGLAEGIAEPEWEGIEENLDVGFALKTAESRKAEFEALAKENAELKQQNRELQGRIDVLVEAVENPPIDQGGN